MKRKLFFFLIIATLLTACGQQKDEHDDWSEARRQMESRGQTLLSQARTALGRQDFAASRSIIRTLREECDLAFEAREQGILLMDSIDLQEALQGMVAIDSLIQVRPETADSLSQTLEEYNQKIKFYRRKLQHDKEASKALKK